MECLSLPSMTLAPARSPSSPFGKGSNAQKAGTPDAGPEGPAAMLSNITSKRERPSVQLPAGGERKAGFIGLFGEKARIAAGGFSRLCGPSQGAAAARQA